jgi:hypothetical protein
MRENSTMTAMERNLASAAARAEFEVPRVTAWLADLRRQGLGLALPGLILKLDTLGKVSLPALQRVELLRLFNKPVLKILASLPKPVIAATQASPGAAPAGLTLEQRLLRLMQINLKQALYDLFKVEFSDDDDAADNARAWTSSSLFDFMERQIRYGVDWRVPWPPGTWQDLHDVFAFLSARVPTQVLSTSEFDMDGSGMSRPRSLDAENVYKRLLLLGLASQFKPNCCDDPDLSKNLDVWAAESRLDEPERRVWDIGVYMVEVGRDVPPRHYPGVLEDTFHGWVLEPARGFLAYVGRSLAPEVPASFHPFDRRRVAGVKRP